MNPRRISPLLLSATSSVLLLTGCSILTEDILGVQEGDLGRLLFDDQESAELVGANDFAVGDTLHLGVGPNTRKQLTASSSDEGVLVVDPVLTKESDGTSTLTATAVGSGSARIELRDRDGALVDRLTVNVRLPSDVDIEPEQFGIQSGKTIPVGGELFLFQGGKVPLFTTLVEVVSNDAPNLLKGQVAGDATSENPSDVTFAPRGGNSVNLGPFSSGGLLLEAEESTLDLVALGSSGTTNVALGLDSFTHPFAVTIVPLTDPLAIEASLLDDTVAPVSSGIVGVTAQRTTDNVEVFGGTYRFSEIPNLTTGPLLALSTLSGSDEIFFTALGTGLATVKVELLDAQGNTVTSDTVSFPVFVDSGDGDSHHHHDD